MTKAWNGSSENKSRLEEIRNLPKRITNLNKYLDSQENKTVLSMMTARAKQTWVGSLEHQIVFARALQKAHDTWSNSPENKTRLARLNGSREHKMAAARAVRKHPNNGEAVVFVTILNEDPELFWSTRWFEPVDGLRGVPDLSNLEHKVIAEYDGGGHAAFGDRTADDIAKDAERRMAGFSVIRDTDPFITAMKYLVACGRRSS